MKDDAHRRRREQFDPYSILQRLVDRDVRFVLIGGLAGNAHGSTTVTWDLDICYQRTPDNMERLAQVLRDLRVTLRGAPADLPFQIDAASIRNGLNFTFGTEDCDFDCLGEASGYTYEILKPNAVESDLGGMKVFTASLDDLIRMKRAAGRNKDLIEIENLSKLRDVREERGLYGLAEPVVPIPAGQGALAARRSGRATRSGVKARSR